MANDRIIAPEQVADILRAYLGGEISGAEAAYRAMSLAGSSDRILAGHQTRPVVAAYWALRRLAESSPTRPSHDEMNLLLECVEGRRRFPQED